MFSTCLYSSRPSIYPLYTTHTANQQYRPGRISAFLTIWLHVSLSNVISLQILTCMTRRSSSTPSIHLFFYLSQSDCTTLLFLFSSYSFSPHDPAFPVINDFIKPTIFYPSISSSVSLFYYPYAVSEKNIHYSRALFPILSHTSTLLSPCSQGGIKTDVV